MSCLFDPMNQEVSEYIRYLEGQAKQLIRLQMTFFRNRCDDPEVGHSFS